jgi:hypothetical protein
MGIDGAEVRSARGTTTIPITWQPLTAGPGSEKSRQIWGIAYNGALQRERTRITCSEEDWNNPDNRVFYSDESVCMTVDQLRSLKLAGTPMRVQHKTDLPPVGEILDNWVDKEGRLWIHAEVPADTPYQTEMIKLIDNGHCSDLSISYGVERDPDTGEVFQLPVDEISFVTEGHFRGCRVGVKASNAKNDMIPTAKTTFRFVNASFGSRMSTQTPTGTTTTGGANSSQQPDLNDLMDRAAKNTKERVDALKELEETRKRLKETEDRLKAKEEEEKTKKEAEDKAREEARRKYAEQHRPDAEEVIKHLTEVLKAENVPLSEEWKQLELDILTNPEPMARENTAVTIACSKKIKCQSQTIGELQAELKKKTQALEMMNAMHRVEGKKPVFLPLFFFSHKEKKVGDEERHEERRKRPVAAAAQKTGMVPDKREPARPVQPWVQQLLGAGYQPPASYGSASAAAPTQSRQLAAGAQKPAAKKQVVEETEMEVDEEDEDAEHKKQVEAARSRSNESSRHVPVPIREGFPVNEHSFRNDPKSKGFFEHMKNCYQGTLSFENSGAHHGGWDFTKVDNF